MSTGRFRDHREELVREHMASEDDHRFEDTIATFTRPRYEVVATDEVIDGEDALRAFYAESDTAFPDFHFENSKYRHLDDAVLVETEFVGTHLGSWRGLPATNRPVRYRMCNLFEFEGEALVCERLHFDLLTVLKQIGIARDPTTSMGRIMTFLNHPIVVGGAMLGGGSKRKV